MTNAQRHIIGWILALSVVAWAALAWAVQAAQGAPHIEDFIPLQTMFVGLCGAVAILCGVIVRVAVTTAVDLKKTNTEQWAALNRHGDRLTAVETRCREMHRRQYDPPDLDPSRLRCNEGEREGDS